MFLAQVIHEIGLREHKALRELNVNGLINRFVP